jgi:hypothetical protein
MFFVTLCDKESKHKTKFLSETLKGDLIVLDTYDKSIGNFSKLFKFADFLRCAESSDISQDDIICFVDAFDMLCIKYDPVSIEAAFRDYGHDILIGSEENCGPEHPSFVKEFFNPGPYLNGGFQIGYKKSFIKLHDYIRENFETLKANLEIDRTTEQGIISQVYIKNIFNIGLDTESKLVNNWGPDRAFRNLDSFFIHVVRADSGIENFDLKSPEVQNHFLNYVRGQVKYEKYIDMFLRVDSFIEQSRRYKELVQKYSTTSSQTDTHTNNVSC